jgi:hypothetical protein
MGRHKGSVVDSTYVPKYNYKKLQHVNESQNRRGVTEGLILTMRGEVKKYSP